MIRRLLIASALLVAPTMLFAQRSGRTQADKKTALFDKQEMPKGLDLRVRDIEDQSPLHLLLDKRKDLKLTDAQLSQLKDAEGKLKDKNAPLYKAVDSLVRATRVTSDASDQDKARARMARSDLKDVIKSITDNYDAAGKEAVATLDAEQQPKAKEMVDKRKEESDKCNRERLSERS